MLLTSSFNENDFQVVSGGLLILSVVIPNIPSFVERLRALGGRSRLRSEAPARSGQGSEASARG